MGSIWNNRSNFEVVTGEGTKQCSLDPNVFATITSGTEVNWDRLKTIDSYVEKVPYYYTVTISSLARYLKSECWNDLETVRAIYKWIITNVSYDSEGLKTGNLLPCDASSVLRNRRTVCSGYAQLFVALCRQSGIWAVKLDGYAKGSEYLANNPYTLRNIPDHSWNAVNLNSKWHLVDCTWDAGYKDENGYIHQAGNSHYFLTDPDIFLDDHFPCMRANIEENKKLQLVDTPIDIKVFGERIVRYPMYFSAKVKLLSHGKPVISVNKKVKICIQGQLTNIIAHLQGLDNNLNFDQYLFVSRASTDVFEILILPPKIATYTLSILGDNHVDGRGKIVTYLIKCEALYERILPFPKHSGVWGPLPDFSNYGFEAGVTRHVTFVADNGEFETFLPVTTNIEKPRAELFHADGAEMSPLFVLIEKQGKGFLLKVRLVKRGYYKLSVYAKPLHTPRGVNECVVNYLILSTNGARDNQIFPKTFQDASKYGVTILEPLSGNLKKGSKVTFRFHSTKLMEMMADNEVINKPDNRKSGIWKCTLVTPNEEREFGIYGCTVGQSDLTELFRYYLV